MRTRFKGRFSFLFALVCTATAGAVWGSWAASPAYSVVDVGPYPLPSYSGPSSGMPPDPSEKAGYDKSSEDHALIHWFGAGRMKDLEALMRRRARHGAFEAAGDSMTDDGKYQAYFYQKQKVTGLGTLPGDDNSIALSLNNRGEAVGVSGRQLAVHALALDASSYTHPHPFLYVGGRMVDLNRLVVPSSGWTLQQADQINDQGQIMGYGRHDGQTRTFLLIPKQFTRKP